MHLPKSFNPEQCLDWWVEIITTQPDCTYYFGPFLTTKEAQYFLPGYIEDLNQEGCQEVNVQIKQCLPEKLTVCAQESESMILA